jgi:hypothetical protein
MSKSKIVFSFLLVSVALWIGGASVVHGTGGLENPWGIDPKAKGTRWTGTIVMAGEIADVSGLPAGLPEDALPLLVPTLKDQIIKIKFFLKLDNSQSEPRTFSGLAKDNEGYYLFYALGDYASTRIGEALNRFLSEKVYPFLPGGPWSGGAIKAMGETSNNVESQLLIDPDTGVQFLKAESPLYYSAKITIVTW